MPDENQNNHSFDIEREMKLETEPIDLLLVEDDEDDFIIVRHYIEKIPNWHIHMDWAISYQAALEKVSRKTYDIFIIDFLLGGKNGIDLMRCLNENGYVVPIVILTGKGNRDIDIQAMNEGAADYIEKRNLSSDYLERCIRYSIERTKSIKQIRKSEKRLKILSKKYIESQERERKLIARELHDSIGSSLTAIKYALETKLNHMNVDSTLFQGISVEDILSMVKDAMEETRRISTSLRPSIIDDIGIVKTIKWAIRRFQEVSPETKIVHHVDLQETDMPEHLKIVVYRIIQEALNNALKYSQADAINISCRKSVHNLEFKIEDNGKGFDLEEIEGSDSASTGMGLEGMRDRTEISGGSFEISSEKGKGSVIVVMFPVYRDRSPLVSDHCATRPLSME